MVWRGWTAGVVALCAVAGCARTPRVTLEPEQTITKTWVGEAPPATVPPREATPPASPPPPAGSPMVDPSYGPPPAAPAEDGTTVDAPASTRPATTLHEPSLPTAPDSGPPPIPTPRRGWTRAGSWDR